MTRQPCPACGRMKPAFAIRDGRCDEDEREAAQQAASRPELSWNDIRGLRSVLLQRSDWTQVADAPLSEEQKTAWAAYRQSLRDIPEAYATPGDVIWPTPPG